MLHDLEPAALLWTWFNPEGSQSVEKIGMALVDMVLGGLLVDRRFLSELASADGIAARTMREVVRDVAVEGSTGAS